MVDLGTLGGSSNTSYAYGLNDSGQVVGASDTPSSGWHAFLWKKGVMADLGYLSGDWSEAYGINEHDRVVGASAVASGEVHAFLWGR